MTSRREMQLAICGESGKLGTAPYLSAEINRGLSLIYRASAGARPAPYAWARVG